MLRLVLFGGASKRPSWPFMFDFFVFPLLAAVLIAVSCRSWGWVGMAGLGFSAFTLLEYFAHRVPLHSWFYHGSHERHHTHPKEYVVFPIYVTPVFFSAAALMMQMPVFVGFVVGYIWFLVWHHVLHHIDLNAWPAFVRRYALWHLAHHHDENCNFGITVPVWDFVFGTYRKVN